MGRLFRDTNTPNTQVIHFGFRHAKACFYIPETLVVRELSEGHIEELLATGKFIILYLPL
jgi:hypothetical protein